MLHMKKQIRLSLFYPITDNFHASLLYNHPGGFLHCENKIRVHFLLTNLLSFGHHFLSLQITFFVSVCLCLSCTYIYVHVCVCVCIYILFSLSLSCSSSSSRLPRTAFHQIHLRRPVHQHEPSERAGVCGRVLAPACAA